MKRQYAINIRGKRDTWSFPVEGTPEHAAEWIADGLDVIEIAGSIPAWLPTWATRPWLFFQDLFYFRDPFKK